MKVPSLSYVVIEDELLIQFGIEQALSAYPQLSLIGKADDGCVGVELVLKNQPDLVLMDIGLPGIDGIEATRQIKENSPKIKVVMLTSHRNEADILASFTSGAEAYCIKGDNIDILVAAIITAHQGGVYIDPLIAQVLIKSLPPEPTEKVYGTLTSREFDVLELLVQGYSNPQIGQKLDISINTVKVHMRGLMNKLLANDRVQVAVNAMRAGLI